MSSIGSSQREAPKEIECYHHLRFLKTGDFIKSRHFPLKWQDKVPGASRFEKPMEDIGGPRGSALIPAVFQQGWIQLRFSPPPQIASTPSRRFHPIPRMNRLHIALATGLLLTAGAWALEPRTWVLLDGRVFEATLENVQGNFVKLIGQDGQPLQIDRALVSIGDNDYLQETFPDAKPPASTAGTGANPMPLPGKLAKIDQRTFQSAPASFQMPTDTWDVLETPHFKVLFQKPVDPRDCAELAERLWLDAAYVHATFPQKFAGSQKMVIFITPTDDHFGRLGTWYEAALKQAGNDEAARKVAATWAQSAAGTIDLTPELTRQYQVLPGAQVFRATRKGPGQRPDVMKGVWQPLWIHCLSGDLLDIQAGTVSSFGAQGLFALFSGQAYYKEVTYTGRSDTSLLRTQSASGRDVSTVGGLADSAHWPGELKKLIRKGDVKPTLENVYALTRETADAKSNVLAYAWARYLQSTPPRLACFSKLFQRISTSHQIPEPADLAKIYGFDSAAALEADFAKYLASPEFR